MSKLTPYAGTFTSLKVSNIYKSNNVSLFIAGGKLVCPSLLSVPACVVYSLGSRLDYSFEEDILKRTPCQVVTFDCTVDGASVHPRHTFVKKCLGTASAMKVC